MDMSPPQAPTDLDAENLSASKISDGDGRRPRASPVADIERGEFIPVGIFDGLLEQELTFTQQSAISSIIPSSRPHNAAVHCGAVRFVGSVLTRDLYMGGDCGVPDAVSSSESRERSKRVTAQIQAKRLKRY